MTNDKTDNTDERRWKMLSREDMASLIAEDERRLGIGSREFMERHNEIMAMADDMRSRYKKNAPTSTANTDRSE